MNVFRSIQLPKALAHAPLLTLTLLGLAGCADSGNKSRMERPLDQVTSQEIKAAPAADPLDNAFTRAFFEARKKDDPRAMDSLITHFHGRTLVSDLQFTQVDAANPSWTGEGDTFFGISVTLNADQTFQAEVATTGTFGRMKSFNRASGRWAINSNSIDFMDWEPGLGLPDLGMVGRIAHGPSGEPIILLSFSGDSQTGVNPMWLPLENRTIAVK